MANSGALVGLLAGFVLPEGCGGGGRDSGGGGPSVALLSVASLPSMPGGGGGPNGSKSLPTSFRDQTLLFQFAAPLDDGVFGGFHPPGSVPIERQGVALDGSPVPRRRTSTATTRRTSSRCGV